MTVERSTIEKTRSLVLSMVVVLSVVALGVAGASGVAAAETEITSCTDITSSGTYVIGADLTKDQTGNGDACIEIAADDVYLDGQGHAITGGAAIDNPNYGVYVNGATNVTITDVSVDGWDEIGHGLRTDGATDVTFRDVTATNNSYGVSVLRTDGFTVENVTAKENNRAGMQSYNSTMGVFRDVEVVNNSDDVDGWYGLRVVEESSDVLVENATVTGTGNNGNGIRVSHDVLSNVTIREATVLDNDRAGLRVESSNVTIENVTARGNNWSFVMEEGFYTDGPAQVEGLDVGDSTAPNTTLSFEAWNVKVRGNSTPPSNIDATDIGRFFEVEKIENDGYLDASVEFSLADTERVTSYVSLQFWRFDGNDWIEIPDRSIDDIEKPWTVSSNVTESGTIGVFGTSPIASYDAPPVNEIIVQGEPLELELKNVTDTKGQPYDGSHYLEIDLPNGSVVDVATSIDNGTGVNALTVLSGNETEDLATGTYTGLTTNLGGNDSVNDTYDFEVVESEIASYEVVPLTDTVHQGVPFAVDFTNVTHVRGGPYTGELNVSLPVATMPFGFVENVSIVDGESTSSVYALQAIHTAQIEPGEYEVTTRHYPLIPGIEDTYNVTVEANTFEVESEFAGVVHDDGGLKINATRLPTLSGNAKLTVAGQEVSDSISIQNWNVSATVDLSEHLDPETATGTVTVKLEHVTSSWEIDPLTDEVRLVHEAYDLDEGYTRWSIPQPADIYVSDGVDDVTQWSNADASYDDVGFEVNTGETVTDGEDLHKGLYVNAGTADERIGYDYVTPGEEGLAPGGAEPISEGWNLLSSNYDVSTGNETLNLDLNTVTNLPANVTDYEGDEGMVAHDPSTFVRIGGDDVIDPYDTYWVYVDVGVDGETRAISSAEYDPVDREALIEALTGG